MTTQCRVTKSAKIVHGFRSKAMVHLIDPSISILVIGLQATNKLECDTNGIQERAALWALPVSSKNKSALTPNSRLSTTTNVALAIVVVGFAWWRHRKKLFGHSQRPSTTRNKGLLMTKPSLNRTLHSCATNGQPAWFQCSMLVTYIWSLVWSWVLRQNHIGAHCHQKSLLLCLSQPQKVLGFVFTGEPHWYQIHGAVYASNVENTHNNTVE